MGFDITIILVSFNPDYQVLNKCLSSIPEDVQIIIIDNSKNFKKKKIKNFLKKKIKIFLNNNYGNGQGINFGLEKANSKYVLYLDLDTVLPKNFLENLFKMVSKIENFAVIAPSLEGYNYAINDYKYKADFKQNNEFVEMNYVQGAIMLFNKDKLKEFNIKFDEKIFLYWEEYDLFKQCKKNNQKIFLLKNVFAYHQGGSSIDKRMNTDIELNRNWHYMWSKFYYFKKNFGVIKAYAETLPHFISGFFKLIIYTILFNQKKNLYYERISGLFFSYLNKPSIRRPKI